MHCTKVGFLDFPKWRFKCLALETLLAFYTLSARFLKSIVSDPSNARYGQYLTKDEVEELIKPTVETFSAVHDWLLTNGIEIYQTSTAKDWIYLNVSISTAEMLLNTNYHVY